MVHTAAEPVSRPTHTKISTVADWQELIGASGDWGKHFILTGDIDFNGINLAPVAKDTYAGPLGFEGITFTGVFDGNGHVLRNASMLLLCRDYVGLFGCVDYGAEIRNLGVENVNIAGLNLVGGLCGLNCGTISYCYATSNVWGYSCGLGNPQYLGGLCGGNLGMISYCYATGTVIGGNQSAYLGGLCGDNNATIFACYATGAVTGGDFSMYLGGLCGVNYYGTIIACYSTGAVWGGSISQYLGGLCGGNIGTISACFWDIETSLDTSDGGTGKTTAEMKTMSTFTDAGWDFVGENINGTNDIWRMCVDGVQYSLLSWEFVPDFVCPDGVDILDLAFFVDEWLAECNATNNFCDCTDINYDQQVDFLDFAILAEYWFLPPGSASNPNPADGATGVYIDTDLSWTAYSGATSHDVYFGTTNPPPFVVNQTGTTYDTGTMPNSTTYYWRIDEKNALGTTTGVVWSFTTAAPPGQATNPSPANGATDVSTTADLNWTTGSGATSHDVYFGTVSPPPFIKNQTGTTYDTGTMANSTTYYWRIDEKNPHQGSTTGVVWSFTTASPPGQATNPSPANGATGVSETADLSWTAGSGATSHDVYFGTVSPPPFIQNQTATTYDTGTMASSTTYYWRIDEKGAGGTTMGVVWSFRTTAPTFVAAGTVASSNAAITPALPSGLAANDILLLFLETANEAISISNQNGGTWTEVTVSPQGTGTAGHTDATRLTVFWSRYNGSQGAPTTSDSGNHQIGRIIAIRGAIASGNPWDVTAGSVESTSDTSGAIPGATTTVGNILVVAAIATDLPDATGTANFSAWANSNLTNVNERTDDTDNAGNGGGLGIATGVKVTAGAYGDTTVTVGTSAVKGMMSIAIKP